MADQEWVMISLDDKMARRYGLPSQVPVPKANFEALADSGLSAPQVRQWIAQFMQSAPSSWRFQNGALASRYDAFLGKGAHWDKAQKAFASRDMNTAVKALELVCRLDPQDHAAKYNLAMTHASLGAHDKALKLLEEVRESFAEDPDYHVSLGQMHMALGDRDKAISEMVLALEARPDCKPAMDALTQMGVLLSLYEDPKDPMSLTYVRTDSLTQFLEELWARQEREAAYYLTQARYHHSERRYEAARQAVQRGLALSAEDAVLQALHRAHIDALLALARKDEALAASQAFAKAYPESAQAHLALALTQPEEAQAELDKALALEPGHLEALQLRFWPQDAEDLDALHKSLPSLAAYAEQNAQCPGAWQSLARATIRLGDAPKGLELLEKAVALAPENDELRAEYWRELRKAGQGQKVLELVAQDPERIKRHVALRWEEAETLAALGQKNEARAAFATINRDESLDVAFRKKAKRAAMEA